MVTSVMLAAFAKSQSDLAKLHLLRNVNLKLLSYYWYMKCRNCDKEFLERESEFCSQECEDSYYDIHKP